MSKPYFVIGCGRSGTTAVCSILDTAKNGICNNEPFPNLARESRKMMEGRLTDPSELVESTIVARVRKNEKEGMIYGEKNITFAPLYEPYMNSWTVDSFSLRGMGATWFAP